MDTFSIGDKVVYPTQGVGEVIGIEVREVSGQRKQFYILRIIDTSMTVLVPTDNTSSVGLREVIPKSEVSGIYGVLKQKKLDKVRQTWNRRHREYMDKLKTGCLYNVAEIRESSASCAPRRTSPSANEKCWRPSGAWWSRRSPSPSMPRKPSWSVRSTPFSPDSFTPLVSAGRSFHHRYLFNTAASNQPPHLTMGSEQLGLFPLVPHWWFPPSPGILIK